MAAVGLRNVLIEGVSGTGKTSVCRELRRRGFDAINGDTDLAYQGDPETGLPVTGPPSHRTHIWQVDAVRARVADHTHRATFFCGGSRNFPVFAHLFDAIFVLDVDVDTLRQRLDNRPTGEFGADPSERELVLRLHRTKADVPSNAVVIDATAPLAEVVDEILRLTSTIDAASGSA